METDRRNVIVAIAASATSLTVPTTAVAAPADRRAWEMALARLEVADRECREYCAKVFDPAYSAEKAFEAGHGITHKLPTGDWAPDYWRKREALHARVGTAHVVPEHIHDQVDALSNARVDAEDAVMQTPAPDLAALRWKLDRALEIEHATDAGGGNTPSWSFAYVRQMLDDITRLLPLPA